MIGNIRRGLPSSDSAAVTSDDGRHHHLLLLVVFPLAYTIGGKGAVLLEPNCRTILCGRSFASWLVAANKRLLLVEWHASIDKYYDVIVNSMCP